MDNRARIEELTGIRTGFGYSQQAMAHLLELELEEYQAFERGKVEIPNLYILVAERIAMTHAVLRGAPRMAPQRVKDDAVAFARLTAAWSSVFQQFLLHSRPGWTSIR